MAMSCFCNALESSQGETCSHNPLGLGFLSGTHAVDTKGCLLVFPLHNPPCIDDVSSLIARFPRDDMVLDPSLEFLHHGLRAHVPGATSLFWSHSVVVALSSSARFAQLWINLIHNDGRQALAVPSAV